jgi:hypothetical protein
MMMMFIGTETLVTQLVYDVLIFFLGGDTELFCELS